MENEDDKDMPEKGMLLTFPPGSRRQIQSASAQTYDKCIFSIAAFHHGTVGLGLRIR